MLICNLTIFISALVIFFIVGIGINTAIKKDFVTFRKLKNEQEQSLKVEQEQEVFAIMSASLIWEIEIYLQEVTRKE